MSNSRGTIIFTGGHHTSALEVAKLLKQHHWNIIWLGHKYSMWGDTTPSAEYREVSASGITFIELKAGKLHRTYHPAKLIRIPSGFFQAYKLIKQIKAEYGSGLKGIVTFGGYLGVPVIFCGWLLGISSVSHEQTTVTGWANKFISVFVKKIAVTWPSGLSMYPKTKTIVTGLPLRPEIIDHLKHPPVREKKIYITGGKQGSHIINLNVFSILSRLLERYRVVHQTGSSSIFNDYREALQKRAELPHELMDKYEVFDYLDAGKAVANIFSSRVVVGRSGAHITYELAVSNTNCVLIPLPGSSHSEQEKNAQVLADHQLAVVLPQTDLTGETLLKSIEAAQSMVVDKLELPLDGSERMLELVEKTFEG